MAKTAKKTKPAAAGEVSAPTMAAPAATFTELPISQIRVVSNTRTHFDDTALAELAQSIREQGILQPLIVRPTAEADVFELVAGERRFRASKLAGLIVVPAMVRTLSDQAFLEVQILENLQRVDVNPADEAVGFSKLLAAGVDVQVLADKVGRTRAFVEQRAALGNLTDEWLNCLRNGQLTVRAAVLLSALLPEQQRLAGQRMNTVTNDDKLPMVTVQSVKSFLERDILHKLATAIFPLDDAHLVKHMGACVTCPARTSCQTSLFVDVNDAEGDRCLQPDCFALKEAAYLKRREAELRAEYPNLVVLVAYGKADLSRTFERWDFSGFKPEPTKGYVPAFVIYEHCSEYGKFLFAKPGSNLTIDKETGKVVKASASAERRAETQQTIRKNKIEAKQKLILADQWTQILMDPTREVSRQALLMDKITNQLRAGGGPHKDAIAFLHQQFGMSLPSWTKDTMYKEKDEWVADNLHKLSYAQLIALQLAWWIFQDARNEYSSSLLALAERMNPWTPDLDVAGALAEATAAVDAPKGKKAAKPLTKTLAEATPATEGATL